MSWRPSAILLICWLPALAGLAKAHAKKPAPGARFRPDAYSLRAEGGVAIPLSPRGPDSFAVSYAQGLSAGGGFFAHWGPWGLGLEGTGASFAHRQVDHTSVTLDAGALVLERLLCFEEGSQEGLVLQAGAGWGSGQLQSPYPGALAWDGPAVKLGLGYRIPLAEHWRVDILASSWGLLGDAQRDPVFMGKLSGGLGLWW